MAVSATGTVKKSTYCKNCFASIEWDAPADEISISTTRNVICPECDSFVNIADCKVEEVESEEDQGDG